MAVSDTLINTLFHGRYRILRKLGTGGMANVYLAEDQELGRRVAIKILNERHAADDQFVERFRREAKNAASLSHPNIVSIYDRGKAEGTYYIAMEYLDGRSLKELIVARGPAPVPLAVDYARQILGAIRFAHRHGIVHRDIKPHNVLVDTEGRLKVTDFGIARAGASQMTEAGSIIGTAQYLSPEQAKGAPVARPREEGARASRARRPQTAVTNVAPRVSEPVPYAPPAAYYDYDEPRRRALWPWFVALLFVVAAVVGGYFLYDQIQTQLSGSKVAVENYRDLREIASVRKIRGKGLRVQVVRQYNANVDETYVFKQDPQPGERIEKGNYVTIFSSLGPPKTDVPSVVGEKLDQALADLQNANLKGRRVPIDSDQP